MLTVKVFDERGVNNVPGRDPAPLLGAVALPVHQVLVAPTPTADVEQAANCVNLRPINESGGWWGFGAGVGTRTATPEGLDTGHMEGGVDAAEGRREVQANRRGVDHLGDGVGADEAWVQFWGSHLQRKVTRGKPHPLPLGVVGSFDAATVSLTLHSGL